LGVIDGIVPEPEGGAHTDFDAAATMIGQSVRAALEELEQVDAEELRRRRRARFRTLGVVSS